jgi:predicted PurR-regulated permease PerM
MSCSPYAFARRFVVVGRDAVGLVAFGFVFEALARGAGDGLRRAQVIHRSDDGDPRCMPVSRNLPRGFTRALISVAFVVALLVFATTVATALVTIASAVIIAVALNGPVTWMERRGVARVWGTLGILGAAVVVFLGVALLVGATFVNEVDDLVESVPAYLDSLEARSDELFAQYPALDQAYEPVRDGSATKQVGPTLQHTVTKLGQASAGVAALLVYSITWLTIVIFLTIEPRSVLRMLLRITPEEERDAVERVVVQFSGVVRGWLWANVLVGGIQAAAILVFLTMLGTPAALVWAVLGFFSVFIPKVGAFIAGAPPVIVSLAVDPMDALWIILFYVALTEVTSDLLLPRLQSQTMRLHAVYIITFVLIFGSTFGLLGAILATPLAGLVAAIWNEFVVSRRPEVPDVDARVERMLGAGSAAVEERGLRLGGGLRKRIRAR